ncbi:MAG TPA: cyclase family protein [Candidatus Limnocylindrales bacterium]|nr:cyclase family protein [Candidatus Limnocylindrales bacterium]
MDDMADVAEHDWIDVSVPLGPATPIFEGDPMFHLEPAFTIAGGAICNVSRLDMGVHSGTHLDAPVHFIDGAPASESIPLEAGIGPAWVADGTAIDGAAITAPDIAALEIPGDATRLLFKTRNSALWAQPGFQTSFVGLDAGAAAELASRGLRLVGVDYLSVAPFGDPVATHRSLLSAGVVILEGLDLREVEPGPVDLLCLPIRLVASDGVPARVLVRPRS